MADIDLEAVIKQDIRRQAAPDKLEQIRDKVRHLRDLEARITDVEELGKRLRAEKVELEMFVLPDLFAQIGITNIGVEAEGNMPAYEAEVTDYYKAVIAADWPEEQRQRAIEWLQENNYADLVKTSFVIELGRGTAKIAEKVEKALMKMKVAFQVHKTVNWKTLTAMVKERFQQGKPLGDHELNILGATVGRIVKPKRK
jgi:hypothetical protein